jgi:hypothetical protein
MVRNTNIHKYFTFPHIDNSFRLNFVLSLFISFTFHLNLCQNTYFKIRPHCFSLTKKIRATIFLYVVFTFAMILGHHLWIDKDAAENAEEAFLKKNLASETNVFLATLALTIHFGVVFVLFSTDLMFLIVGLLMFEVVLTYLRHVRECLNELRMRNRLELAAKMWPSDESNYVVDIKYLVCMHQYAIK